MRKIIIAPSPSLSHLISFTSNSLYVFPPLYLISGKGVLHVTLHFHLLEERKKRKNNCKSIGIGTVDSRLIQYLFMCLYYGKRQGGSSLASARLSLPFDLFYNQGGEGRLVLKLLVSAQEEVLAYGNLSLVAGPAPPYRTLGLPYLASPSSNGVVSSEAFAYTSKSATEMKPYRNHWTTLLNLLKNDVSPHWNSTFGMPRINFEQSS